MGRLRERLAAVEAEVGEARAAAREAKGLRGAAARQAKELEAALGGGLSSQGSIKGVGHIGPDFRTECAT